MGVIKQDYNWNRNRHAGKVTQAAFHTTLYAEYLIDSTHKAPIEGE